MGRVEIPFKRWLCVAILIVSCPVAAAEEPGNDFLGGLIRFGDDEDEPSAANGSASAGSPNETQAEPSPGNESEASPDGPAEQAPPSEGPPPDENPSEDGADSGAGKAPVGVQGVPPVPASGNATKPVTSSVQNVSRLVWDSPVGDRVKTGGQSDGQVPSGELVDVEESDAPPQEEPPAPEESPQDEAPPPVIDSTGESETADAPPAFQEPATESPETTAAAPEGAALRTVPSEPRPEPIPLPAPDVPPLPEAPQAVEPQSALWNTHEPSMGRGSLGTWARVVLWLLALAPLLHALELLGRWLVSWIAAGFFSRLTDDEILSHPRRRALYEFVRNNPGERLELASRALGISSVAALYHLRVLEVRGRVRFERHAGLTRLLPCGPRRPIPPYLRPLRRRILELLAGSPGLSQKEVARALGTSQRAMSYHIRWMSRRGLVEVQQAGKLKRCYAPASAPPASSA